MFAITEWKPTQILSASGAGVGSALALSVTGRRQVLGWEVRITGNPTAVQIDLEGSLDAANWYQIDKTSSISNVLKFVVDKPVLFVRGKVVTLSGGSSPEVTVVVLQT